MLSKESVERAILEATKEVKSHRLDEKYFEKFTDAPYDKEVLGYFSGSCGYYLPFVSLLVKKLGFKNILELGNYAGASTLAIYSGISPDADFTTVDIVKDQRYCTDEMRSDPRTRFVIGDALDLSIYGERQRQNIDFLYEDTFHYYRHIKDIFDVYKYLLADKALVAIDDIRTNDKGNFFKELPYPKWDLTELCHAPGGWGLVLFEGGAERSLSKEERLIAAYRSAMLVWKRRHDAKADILEKLEARKPKNAMRNFLHRHKWPHSLVIKTKKIFGIIPKTASALDEKRFYSGANAQEMAHMRKNVLYGRDRKD